LPQSKKPVARRTSSGPKFAWPVPKDSERGRYILTRKKKKNHACRCRSQVPGTHAAVSTPIRWRRISFFQDGPHDRNPWERPRPSLHIQPHVHFPNHGPLEVFGRDFSGVPSQSSTLCSQGKKQTSNYDSLAPRLQSIGLEAETLSFVIAACRVAVQLSNVMSYPLNNLVFCERTPQKLYIFADSLSPTFCHTWASVFACRNGKKAFEHCVLVDTVIVEQISYERCEVAEVANGPHALGSTFRTQRLGDKIRRRV
jgi:hypothetical protein